MPTEQANIVPGEIIEGKVQGITILERLLSWPEE